MAQLSAHIYLIAHQRILRGHLTFMLMHPHISQLLRSVSEERQAVLNHPVYNELCSIEELAVFMEKYAYHLWDSTFLLQAIIDKSRHRFGGTALSPASLYLIDQLGRHTRGFEPNGRYHRFISLLEELGTDISSLQRLHKDREKGEPLPERMKILQISEAVSASLLYTFYAIHQLPLHVLVAVYTLGREDLAHQALLPEINKAAWMPFHLKNPLEDILCGHWVFLNTSPAQAAVQLLTDLCGEDQVRWTECTQAVRQTLIRRAGVLDHIQFQLRQSASQLQSQD